MVANPPNDQIYDFKGYFTSSDNENDENREALSLENTLWANTVLASAGHVIAIVVYAGKETRANTRMIKARLSPATNLRQMELVHTEKNVILVMI